MHTSTHLHFNGNCVNCEKPLAAVADSARKSA
jgi:hypothetical protein